MGAFTLIDEGTTHTLDASVSGTRIRVAPDVLRTSLGWELKPQGLCRGEVCVPIADREALVTDGDVDVAGFAAALGRPFAVDVAERVAAIGTAAADRRSRLATLAAPDFELPDLSGNLHTLSEHRGKKVLLIAYASW
jgi:hypothetical protein